MVTAVLHRNGRVVVTILPTGADNIDKVKGEQTTWLAWVARHLLFYCFNLYSGYEDQLSVFNIHEIWHYFHSTAFKTPCISMTNVSLILGGLFQLGLATNTKLSSQKVSPHYLLRSTFKRIKLDLAKVKKQHAGHLLANRTRTLILLKEICWSDVKSEMILLKLPILVHGKRFLQNHGVIKQHQLWRNDH